jgi:hypothetical protein
LRLPFAVRGLRHGFLLGLGRSLVRITKSDFVCLLETF